MLTYIDETSGRTITATPQTWKPIGNRPWQLHSRARFDPALIDHREFSLWRYRHALGIDVSDATWRRTTLGEGATSTVELGQAYPHVLCKMEYAMPTLSFKDRGVSVMMAQAAEWGVERVIVDSSGNAATSVAAYAARLGMKADVFVPAGTSEGKLLQIAAHGADIHRIEGSREDTANATFDFVAKNDGFYASHVYNPLFHQGTKTMIYEIWEQGGGVMPDTLYVPVGNGTMLLGAIYGLKDLLEAGTIEALPHLIAVQSVACAPIAEAFDFGDMDVAAVQNTGTVAEGIAIAAPARGAEILEAVRSVSGKILTVSDEEVLAARQKLSAAGVFVEPTAAVCFAAYMSAKDTRSCLIPLCGAGLKAPK